MHTVLVHEDTKQAEYLVKFHTWLLLIVQNSTDQTLTVSNSKQHQNCDSSRAEHHKKPSCR